MVTITKEQMKKMAALTLTFSAGAPVRSGAAEVKDYISFKYIEPEPELNVGLIAGASVGKCIKRTIWRWQLVSCM